MAGEIISVEEARRLREAATPGPWVPTGPSFGFHVVQHGPGHAGSICGFPANASYNGHNAALIAAAPDLARTVEHLHAELAAEREAVLAFLLDAARNATEPHERGWIATLHRAIELRYHRDPLRSPRADGEVSDG